MSGVARVTSVSKELLQRLSAWEKKTEWWSFHLRQKSSDPISSIERNWVDQESWQVGRRQEVV